MKEAEVWWVSTFACSSSTGRYQ